MEEPAGPTEPTFGERFETSDVGRALISAAIIFALFTVLIANMPRSSNLKQELSQGTQRFANVTGLDQFWSLFAPRPTDTFSLEARLTYADGSTGSWHPPRGGSLIGTYWDHRWAKWMENMITDRNTDLRRPAALWIARQERRDGALPVRVALVETIEPTMPPGPGPAKGPPESNTFYTLNIQGSAVVPGRGDEGPRPRGSNP